MALGKKSVFVKPLSLGPAAKRADSHAADGAQMMAWKKLILILTGLLICGLLPGKMVRSDDRKPMAFIDLEQNLIQTGLPAAYVRQVFRDERAAFLPQVVTKIAYLRKEKPADYLHFLCPAVVAKGRQFLEIHQATLAAAERRYSVAKAVIVAILTVESDLGRVTGRYQVFNVFASLAVMDTPEVIASLKLDHSLMDRLRRKAAWGRAELAAFLNYCHQNRIDPFSIKGSWAGAFGYPQFLPSSLVRCGQDGDQDGRVNLFCFSDAIFSIANYLQRAGYSKKTLGEKLF